LLTVAQITSGSAELFGTELVLSNIYTFTNTKAAIYTWHGCSFEVSGDSLQSEYTAEETPMNEYINIHFALDPLRTHAKASNTLGPRVLLLGPDNAGKTTLAKTLTGYAIRAARSPVVVNIDPSEGVISVPGTLTATVFRSLVDVEEGWGTAPMSGPNGIIPVKLPLVHYYGSQHPEDKDGRPYKSQVNRLALATMGRMSSDPDAREGGLIIDTPGSLSTKGAAGYEIIAHIISEFSVNCIICIGSERLYSDMLKRFDNQPVALSHSTSNSQETMSVIKTSKSGGCVDRDAAFMTAFRAAQIRSYFYGNPRLSNGISLQPRQQQVDFSSLTVWQRLGSFAAGSLAPSSGPADDDEFLPGDFAPPATSSSVPLPATQLFERITSPVPAMRSCILAVLNCEAEPENESELLNASCMGFLYVTEVDESRGKISLLSPVAGRVPGRAVVWGGWPEGVVGMVG
jgi:polyribonucleotide 5'-hydroxyl-kinase